MFFKPYYLGCLANASYLIGGDNGEAAVIDPRRDVDEYLADSVAAGLTIRHVIETHLHADFVSGHVELAKRTGAAIHIGGATPVDFTHQAVYEGGELVMGDVRLRFLETPGHTPEGVSVLAFVGHEADPRMVFTGDTLFIGDEEAFVRALMEGQTAIPPYFPHDVTENRHGAATMEEVRARGRAMKPREVEALLEGGTLVLDTRLPNEYGAGHVPGVVNIGLESKFAPWVGNVLTPDVPVIVVADPGREEEAVTRLARVGYESVVGWLEGGMDAWSKAGGEVTVVPQIPAADLRALLGSRSRPKVLDMRTDGEWASACCRA